jgi:hypothetical protein
VQRLFPHGGIAGEAALRVGVHAVFHGGSTQDPKFRGEIVGEELDDHGIGAEWEMAAVLLAGPHGDDEPAVARERRGDVVGAHLLHAARARRCGRGVGHSDRHGKAVIVVGARSGAAPMRLHVSPRIGFSYTYNKDKENGNGMNQTNVGRFYRTTSRVIRGGIGDFRDLLRPSILADASAATGLPGGTLVLSCVGSAVPTADWTRFASDPSSIPTQCGFWTGLERLELF